MQKGLLLLFFFYYTEVFPQKNCSIFIDGELYENQLDKDTLSLSNYIEDLQREFVSQGYFFSGVDSVLNRNEQSFIYLSKGKKYKSRISVKGSERKNPLKIISKTLKEYASRGYPFAQIRMDSIAILGDIMEGKIKVSEGPEIVYDSAFFFDILKTNKKYIYQLLDITPGHLFNEDNYRVISRKVNRSPFLKIKRPPDIAFQKNKAKIFLDLEEKSTNTFQGILGLQQGQGNSSVVVGSLDLNIDNLFSSGKELDFFWERYGSNSQRLSLFYKHPFFLDSKISPVFSFDLLKQDSIFLTRVTGLGVNTFVSPRINLTLQYKKTSGTLLSNDESEIIAKDVADFDKNMYQLELKSGFYEKLERLNEGVAWKFNIGGGNKEIRKNINLPDTFYDTVRLQTNFFQSQLEVAYQLKIWKRQAFFHQVSGALIKNNEILNNELYRPGGFSSVRGFNEKFFFADQYLVSRMELRSFFEDRSYLYVLYDQLFYGRRDFSEAPFGIGIGFALSTSSGQFSFAIASGKAKKQEVDFSSIRVHFGYVSRF